jgi:hypothetical protein
LVDLKILRRAILVGVVFELLRVAAGYFKPWLRPFFLFGAMLIAGLMGLLYARDLARGFAAGALGGAAVGVLCGLASVLAAHYLGESPDLFLPWGVAVCTLTGAAGGMFGQMDVMIQAYLRKLK